MSQEKKDRIVTIISELSLVVSIIWFVVEPKFETILLVLSTIATTTTLYIGRKRIEKIEARYDNDPQRKTSHTRVALWGPTSSGKTWFIHAFGRVLTKKYRNPVKGLLYNLRTTTGYDFSVPPEIKGTQEEVEYHYIFDRTRTGFNDKAQSLSSFKHEISIVDYKGSDSICLDASMVNSLENADVIVLALDPTSLAMQDFPEMSVSEQYPKIEGGIFDNSPVPLGYFKHWGIGAKEYAEWVRKLLDLLEADQTVNKRYYAVCIMKADQLGSGRGRYKNPEYLVKKYFGSEMVEALQIPDKERIKVFIVSSFGFISDSHRMRPEANYVVDRGAGLKSPDRWEPYHVEFPLFWAFEKLELLFLEESFSKSWWRRLTKKYRIKKYIRYPEETFEK